MINIASGLNHSKEMRDFFLDIVEKIIEPCKQIKLTTHDLNFFLQVYAKSPQFMEAFNYRFDHEIRPELLMVVNMHLN